MALEEPHVVCGAPGCPGPFGLGVAYTSPAADKALIEISPPIIAANMIVVLWNFLLFAVMCSN